MRSRTNRCRFKTARLLLVYFRFIACATRVRWSMTSSDGLKPWKRTQSTCWSSWRWIIWCTSRRVPETAPQPAGRATGLQRYPWQWGDNCTSCTNRTSSCLAIPNRTACSISRSRQAKGLQPTPHLPMQSRDMPSKTKRRCRLLCLCCCSNVRSACQH